MFYSNDISLFGNITQNVCHSTFVLYGYICSRPATFEHFPVLFDKICFVFPSDSLSFKNPFFVFTFEEFII